MFDDVCSVIAVLGGESRLGLGRSQGDFTSIAFRGR